MVVKKKDPQTLKLEHDQLRKIIREWHTNLNRPSSRKLENTLAEIYNISGTRKIFEAICDACPECQRNKKTRTRKGRFKGFLESKIPFDHVCVDILGPLEYKNENQDIQSINLLTIIDICTRWPEMVVLEETTAREVSKSFLCVWLQRYPLPSAVTSDRGVQFLSLEFRKLLTNFGITHKPTLAYNPRGNSICERIHREINIGLRIYQKHKLELIIGKILNGLRSTFHRVLQTTPNNIVFGRSKFNSGLRFNTEELIENAVKTKAIQTEKDLEKINTNRRKFEFIGKIILLENLPGKKLDSPWTGPFRVIDENQERGTLLIDLEYTRQWVPLRLVKVFKERADCRTDTLAN